MGTVFLSGQDEQQDDQQYAKLYDFKLFRRRQMSASDLLLPLLLLLLLLLLASLWPLTTPVEWTIKTLAVHLEWFVSILVVMVVMIVRRTTNTHTQTHTDIDETLISSIALIQFHSDTQQLNCRLNCVLFGVGCVGQPAGQPASQVSSTCSQVSYAICKSFSLNGQTRRRRTGRRRW